MADETNNKNAVFKFYLNRQGVKGNKGEKGEQGFSPIIEVSENTAASYKLQITTETDQFETPNLRGNAVEDLGGTYMRYNPETQTMYADIADIATKTTQGEVTLASDEDVANLSENKVITPAGIVDNATSLFQSSDGSIVISQDENNGKINLKANTSSIEGDITALEARVGTCEGDILSNAGRIQTLEHNLALDEQAIQNNTLAIANKVDKVAGKGLSTNDFTNEDNDKLMHAVVDSDLADVAFTGDYDDLINQPTIPVIPTDNLTGDSVDGTTIVYDNVTGKISATAQTPDLSNYVTKNTAQEINNTKTFLGNSLQVGDGNSSDIVASYDSTIYQTTETGFSRVAGTVIGSLLQGSNSTLATQSMFEYDDDIQDFKIATIFNDFNLTGGTNAAIIKNAQTGKYEIVAHDTVYSQGNGINIDNANQISVKIDNNTIAFNTNGELTAQSYTLPTASTTTLGGVKVDGTTITIDNNGYISSVSSAPINMVTTDTVQTITGGKVLVNNLILQAPSFASTEYGLYPARDGLSIKATAYQHQYYQNFKLGKEGIGSYPFLEGYFFDVEDGQNGIWLGSTNYRVCLTTDSSNRMHVYPNPMINNANVRFTIGPSDELVYRKTDGTVIDILAFETRIATLESKVAALEALINGGNA